MDIFNILTLIGGLSLFLFGMNVMGESLERRAGGSLRSLLSKLTPSSASFRAETPSFGASSGNSTL